MINRIAIFALGLCSGAVSFAQVTAVTPAMPLPPPGAITISSARGEGGFAAIEAGVKFVSAEFAIEGKTIKGSPYSAQAVTETTQTLADGNRIVRKNTASIYRDSEGRVRREQSMMALGPLPDGRTPPPLIVIEDPVAQVSYVLESDSHVARRTSFTRPEANTAQTVAMAKAHKAKLEAEAAAMRSGATVSAYASRASSAEMSSESLGSKTIEGVLADGKRLTRTVPAGQMGNEKPLVYTNEVWTSPDLGVVVIAGTLTR